MASFNGCTGGAGAKYNMLRIAMIARSTLFTAKGGDTVQVEETARHLRALDVAADIRLAHEKIAYADYDLLHFFNITRPADIVHHARSSGKPFVISPIYISYEEYDRHFRDGFAGRMFRFLSPEAIEYTKTIGRWLKGNDGLSTMSYVWQGQKRQVNWLLKNADLLLPNSLSEYTRIRSVYAKADAYRVVRNGVDNCLFDGRQLSHRDATLVLCVARIEGIKNQLNLIRALNGTKYTLLLIGSAAPNQLTYYNRCRKEAGENVQFIDHLPQEALLQYYRSAKVHVLPSWFETTGLSSLEAGAMGCQVVITDKGDTRDYFGDDAFYCDPGSPQSILDAIDRAAAQPVNKKLAEKIHHEYTWPLAAMQTLAAYQQVYESYA